MKTKKQQSQATKATFGITKKHPLVPCWTKLLYKWTDGQTSHTQDSSHEQHAPLWLPFFCVNEDTQDSVRQIPKKKTDPQEDPQEPTWPV
jgi:hypothetical protein